MTAITGSSQLARQLGLTHNISLLNTMLNQQTQQLSTGLKADGLVGVSSQAQELGDLKAQLGTVQNYSSGVQTALNRVNLYSTSMQQIIDIATGALSTMIENRDTSFASTSAPDVQANSLLDQIGSALQVRDGDRYLFSGTNYSANPLNGSLSGIPTTYAAGAIPGVTAGYDDPLVTVTSGATVPQPPYLNTAPANLQNYYDTSNVNLYVDDSEQVTYGISAVDPGIQQVIDAIVRFRDASADISTNPGNYQTRIDDAVKQLNTAITALKATASTNGYNQQQLTEIQDRQANTVDTLKIRIGKIQNVDTAEVSTTITNLQTALEASYYVTNSMLSLSLVNYLK